MICILKAIDLDLRHLIGREGRRTVCIAVDKITALGGDLGYGSN